MWNLRLPPALMALVEEATAVSTLPDKSKWGREALEAGARAELAAHQRETGRTPADDESANTAPSRPALRGVHRGFHEPASTARCVHPLTAREQKVEAEVCGLCGVVTRWRL